MPEARRESWLRLWVDRCQCLVGRVGEAEPLILVSEIRRLFADLPTTLSVLEQCLLRSLLGQLVSRLLRVHKVDSQADLAHAFLAFASKGLSTQWQREFTKLLDQCDVVLDDGIVYLHRPPEGPVTALDVLTRDTQWTTTDGTPIMALDSGGVLLHNAAGLTAFDADGVVAETVSVSIAEPRSIFGGQRALHGLAPTSSGTTEIVIPELLAAERYFVGGLRQGNPQGNLRSTLTCVAPPAAPSKGLRAGPPGVGVEYTYRIIDDPETTADNWNTDQLAGVAEGFRKWNEANVKSGLLTTFAQNPAGVIGLKRAFIPQRMVNGVLRRIPGALDADVDPSDGPISVNDPIEITYNTDPVIMRGREGYLKVTLHEVGHLFGLDDIFGVDTPRQSVMNQFGVDPQNAFTWDDMIRRNVSDVVRECDWKNAYDRSTTP